MPYALLQVALEAAQAYNREKPPHQTVGDTVMMALQYAAMQARKQRENGRYLNPVHSVICFCNPPWWLSGRASDCGIEGSRFDS